MFGEKMRRAGTALLKMANSRILKNTSRDLQCKPDLREPMQRSLLLNTLRSFEEHFPRGLDPVERRRESRIQRHLHDHLDHFLLRTTDVERPVNMGSELRSGRAESRQRRDGGNLTGLQAE